MLSTISLVFIYLITGSLYFVTTFIQSSLTTTLALWSLFLWVCFEIMSLLWEFVSFCCTTHCCSVTKSCLTLWDPMDCSTPGSPVLHYLQEFVQTHVHWVGVAIQWSHPLSPLLLCLQSNPASGSSVALPVCIRYPKYWSFSFSFSISPSNEYSGLISFRTGWFDFAVQGSLKSLLLHHNLIYHKLHVLKVYYWAHFWHRYPWNHPHNQDGAFIHCPQRLPQILCNPSSCPSLPSIPVPWQTLLCFLTL